MAVQYHVHQLLHVTEKTRKVPIENYIDKTCRTLVRIYKAAKTYVVSHYDGTDGQSRDKWKMCIIKRILSSQQPRAAMVSVLNGTAERVDLENEMLSHERMNRMVCYGAIYGAQRMP